MNNIRNFRERYGLTQGDLAKVVGCTRAEIAMFDPKMADHLNKTMNMFWMYTVSMKGIVGRKVTPQLSRHH